MADEKREIKLTNWQVPRSAEGQKIDAQKQAPPLDLDGPKYKDIGKIHEGTTEDAIERTIAKQEAARGVAINQPEQPKINLSASVVDDRKDKEYWTPPRIGRR